MSLEEDVLVTENGVEYLARPQTAVRIINEERAKRGSREKLLAVLAKAPDVEPEEYDRL